MIWSVINNLINHFFFISAKNSWEKSSTGGVFISFMTLLWQINTLIYNKEMPSWNHWFILSRPSFSTGSSAAMNSAWLQSNVLLTAVMPLWVCSCCCQSRVTVWRLQLCNANYRHHCRLLQCNPATVFPPSEWAVWLVCPLHCWSSVSRCRWFATSRETSATPTTTAAPPTPTRPAHIPGWRQTLPRWAKSPAGWV